MNLLGIETSCDETAAAVVASGERVLSNVVASQFDVHGRYGGVVPELASREHLRAIVPVVRQAIEDAGIDYGGVGAIAVTRGPGLVGSLLVGLCYAKALSVSQGVPLIGVNHIEGHIHAVVLEQKQKGEPVEFPAVALVASGGHTHLFRVRLAGDSYEYKLLGRTRDDAAGEAFDKVAKLLGFGYPGGPVIDRLAPHGNPEAVRFGLAKMKGNDLDFSFSGLKTAVLRWVRAANMEEEIERRRTLLRSTPRPTVEQWLEVTPPRTRDLIASFQQAATEELLHRALRAAEQQPDARSLVITGGVACNSRLRERFSREARSHLVYFPSPRLSTDNAVMIAAAAWPKFVRGSFSDLSLAAEASLSL